MNSKDHENAQETETPVANRQEKILPSEFMRDLRPEYYSDSIERSAYILDQPILEHQLESITVRNETNTFQIFCRKLCEKTLSPFIRPNSGPEGGGDGKTDAETHPVAEEIAELYYVGHPNAGTEKWAFAFSAKKDWKAKVRSDVKGIIDTGRKYDKIIFVTNQPAKANERTDIEQKLTEKYHIPVTIYDRAWIVKEIIENDRKDIAYNYLDVGQLNNSTRLGPDDYARTQQLEEIEREITDPDAFRGMESQLVTEALLAAKLSRNTERPQIETEGRFQRAMKLADKYGTYRQKLEARYEHIWSAFWWFDDIQFLNESYPGFEALALKATHVKNLEFLGNLQQLLYNCVIHRHLSRGEADLDARAARLEQALEVIAADAERPNSSLEAKTLLLGIKINQAAVNSTLDELPSVWQECCDILDKAEGLGEFEVERLEKLIDVWGQLAGNNPAYNTLIEKLADFIGKRTSEAEGAIILLKRAKKLDFDDNSDMIRLLGKAVPRLSKKEYTQELIEACHLLTLAYRSAGLLWASRATCIFAAASIIIEGEVRSQIPAIFIPTVKLLAWIGIELRYLPDTLLCIELLNGALAGLPLTDETKERVKKDLQELDIVFGCTLINLGDAELSKITALPNILDELRFFGARAALLYTLGYIDLLREDGSIPPEEDDDNVKQIFSSLASQPAAQGPFNVVITNNEGEQRISTVILGMTVEAITRKTSMVAEVMLGTLEAFFATCLQLRVAPHTEKLSVTVIESTDQTEPAFEIDNMDMKAILTWPSSLSVGSFADQEKVRTFFIEIAAKVLATTCMIDDGENFFEGLFKDEVVQNRMIMVIAAVNSYHRVTGRGYSRLADWSKKGSKSYPIRLPRPVLTKIELEDAQKEAEDYPKEGKTENHRKVSVRSVIDVHTWDQARWRGTAYAHSEGLALPCMALMFENANAAKKIFSRWHERFGKEDINEEIRIAFIRGVSPKNPHHYAVQITSRLPSVAELKQSGQENLSFPSRNNTMEPTSSYNLENFLTLYKRTGAYYLLPAIISSDGTPELVFNLAIVKKTLHLKSAAEICGADIEIMALRSFTEESI